jgi:uncharacterized protein (DUF433 family)
MQRQPAEVMVISYSTPVMGKPVVRSTRTTIELMSETFAAVRAYQVLIEHPRINSGGIRAAFAFAAEALRAGVVYPFEKVS